MRYFTPELYLFCNADNEAVANRAVWAWEEGIAAYQAYLEQIRPQLPPSVQALTELYLHDASVVLVQQEAFDSPAPILLIVLRDRHEVRFLFYSLWAKLEQTEAKNEWPFSTTRVDWLYDEIELVDADASRFRHRVFTSDGRVRIISFTNFMTHTVPLTTPPLQPV